MGLGSCCFDECDHAGQGTAVSLEETLDDILQCQHLCFCVQAVGMNVFAYKADNFFGRCSWAKAALDA